MKWDFYRKLAVVYNLILLGLSYFLVWGFYAHSAFYTWPLDFSTLNPVPTLNRIGFTLVVFVFFKALHWVEIRAEVAREDYERRNSQG